MGNRFETLNIDSEVFTLLDVNLILISKHLQCNEDNLVRITHKNC